MYKVLIVDDEPYVANGLKAIINWEEYGLVIAGNSIDGLEAINFIKKNDIDILITDIKMPKMDGIELIKELKKLHHQIAYIILSGYDDFIYLKEAIKLGVENYLLKPVNEEELSFTLSNIVEKLQMNPSMNNLRKNNLNNLRNNIFYRWVSGNIMQAELNERVDLLDINLDSPYYTIAIVRILESENNSNFNIPLDCAFSDPRINALASICVNTIDDTFKYNCFPGTVNDLVILIHSQSEAFDRETLHELLTKCIKNISQLLDYKVFVTIGSTVRGYEKVKNSYRISYDLMDYNFIMPAQSIASHTKIVDNALKNAVKIDIDFDLIRLSIINRNTDCLFNYINSIYEKLNSLCDINPNQIRNLFIEIAYNVINTSGINIRKRTDNISLLDVFYMQVHELDTASDMLNWIKTIISNVLQNLNSIDRNKNPLVKRVIRYIEKNYEQNLSLKSISASFKVNAIYLGQLFKKETGEMFTNYLNRIRIEKAKEIILNSDLNSAEICFKVGYSHKNYFYTVFKKYTGFYPTEFRIKSDIKTALTSSESAESSGITSQKGEC